MHDKYILHDVYLALGSNLGNKIDNIEKAYENINERIGKIIERSSIYESDPVGFVSDNGFVNTVCHVLTKLDVESVMDVAEIIEYEMGRRVKSEKKIYSDRTIDIDILFFDKEVINNPRLIIPHPHLHERTFVLEPLSEIAPDLIHPFLKKTISELKNELSKKEE